MSAPTGNGTPNNLRELREKANLSQEALARRAGVSVGTIHVVETGVRLPTMTKARKIASALGVKMAAIWPDEAAS